MDELQTLQSLGLTLPSPGYIFGALLFGIIGFAAWRHGRKTSTARSKWLGLALMLYPYLVSDTRLMYLTGAVLCAALFVPRR